MFYIDVSQYNHNVLCRWPKFTASIQRASINMGIKRQIESRHRFLIYMTCQRQYKNGTVRLTSLLIKWSTTVWTSSPAVFDIGCLNWYNAQSKFIKKYRMDRRGYKSCHSISHVYWDTPVHGRTKPQNYRKNKSHIKNNLRRDYFFATNSHFLITISLKPDGVNHWYHKLRFFDSIKIQSFNISNFGNCNDKGIRKSERN